MYAGGGPKKTIFERSFLAIGDFLTTEIKLFTPAPLSLPPKDMIIPFVAYFTLFLIRPAIVFPPAPFLKTLAEAGIPKFFAKV